MFAPMATLAHSFLHLEGPWGVVLEVMLFALLFLHVAALVVLSERALPRRRKLLWALFVLFVPLVGPLVFMGASYRTARAGRSTPA